MCVLSAQWFHILPYNTKQMENVAIKSNVKYLSTSFCLLLLILSHSFSHIIVSSFILHYLIWSDILCAFFIYVIFWYKLFWLNERECQHWECPITICRCECLGRLHLGTHNFCHCEYGCHCTYTTPVFPSLKTRTNNWHKWF